MADEKAPTDWAADVKRYVPDADDAVIAKIVSYCGIALRTRDASMVSFSDAAETDRVREKYCKKKLALEESDEVIDAAIAKVGERMSDTKFRNRVTVYYLLAEHFGKLGLFAPKAAAGAKVVPIAPLAAAAATVAAAPVAAAPTPDASAKADAPVTPPLAATAAGAAAATAGAAAASGPVSSPSSSSSSSSAQAAPHDAPASVAPMAAAAMPSATRSAAAPRAVGPASARGSGGGFFGLAAAMFVGLGAIMIVSAIAGSYIGGRFDAEAPPPPAALPAPAAPATPAAPVIPDGAGIVSEVVEGRPKVSVFFDVGKNDIAPEFNAAVAPVKAWLDANPADRVQLSGFTDPTGNAAANAELAKRRAQAVAAALSEQGIGAERMDLVKPADTSDEATDLAGARRVEITVTEG